MKVNICIVAALALVVCALAVDATSSQKKKQVIIDTDANTDDAIAILWLLKRTDIDIKAITVVGTGWASLSSGLTNIFNMLAFMGRNDIPVTWGGGYALYDIKHNIYGCTYAKTIPNAPGGRQWADTLVGLAHCFPKAGPGRYYNPNAPGAVDLMVQVLNSTRDKVDILALGPATNVADLLSAHPWAKVRIGRVVFSGGAVYVGGNIFTNVPNTYAEYNALGDPDALAAVATSGVSLVLVPLDATGQLIVNQTYLDRLGVNQYTSEAAWVYSLLRTLQTQMGSVFNTYSLWDPYAAAVLVDQSRYADTVNKIKITVVTQDLNASEVGRTKPDSRNGSSVSVVLRPDDVVFDDLIYYLALEDNSSPSPRCTESANGGWYAWN
ncbi:inosineuridine preferring nucleoside hydrolase family protein [Acanthamoeba castellanii str. Neff]|uniref:Inosineuridine preferring nucleoside hydrolase family protein n=1 Tax=Acanthamoeba castellanii (strain ATCC 30010 / Neff) TaxID=1257118 RepID=L8GJS6_ACACF|nr:inosineuridine preferring nucleoside hydrolase family protein [Acanthamoeba castellanii str. Neff]ELR13069.1 inosineuridine preferring nucleoside hydrolase family protein [Acanthamoeba castellanii str. Neff]